MFVNNRLTTLLINSQMYFSFHLKGTAKAKKDEHEEEYWINSQRNGDVRESTAKPSFQFAL